MVLNTLEYLATCRQVEILEETLESLPKGQHVTRSSEVQRKSLEGLIADLKAALDEADLAAHAELMRATVWGPAT